MIKYVTLPHIPVAIVFTPNGKTAYVAAPTDEGGGGLVYPVNTSTYAVGKLAHGGADPQSLAITPNGATVYAGDATADTVVPMPI